MEKQLTNPNDPATGFSIQGDESRGWSPESVIGLTKHEKFAAMAMQGLLATLARGDGNWSPNEENIKYCAYLSVIAADELIDQLNM